VDLANLTLPIIVAAITTLLVLGVGGWMTTVGPWYQNLRKPWWNPPNWIFGPAWTVILGLAAWSGVLAWTYAAGSTQQLLILSLFGINIVLHMLWSPLFFNFKRPDWALIEVPFLWLSIVALMFGVAPSSTLASWLLLPYLLWVAFAAFLNLTIVRMTRRSVDLNSQNDCLKTVLLQIGPPIIVGHTTFRLTIPPATISPRGPRPRLPYKRRFPRDMI
jgi:benzodiazapine receptor